jgi:hypothetical protein
MDTVGCQPHPPFVWNMCQGTPRDSSIPVPGEIVDAQVFGAKKCCERKGADRTSQHQGSWRTLSSNSQPVDDDLDNQATARKMGSTGAQRMPAS